MRNNRLIIIFSILFLIALGFFIYSFSLDPQKDDRDGLRPREGITIGHNKDVNITRIEFYFVNTEHTDSIELRYDSFLLDPTQVGKIGIYFPYKVTMTSDPTDWKGTDIESGTVFMKKYSCNAETYCKRLYNDQPVFKLKPENTKFDSKNRYKHVLKISIDHTVPPDADEFFREYDWQNHPLEFRFDDSSKREATIIIPENADNIHPLPIPDPDVFHNSGNDYGNAQLDWHMSKWNHAFFVDYELPEERKQFEDSQLGVTISGIAMGIFGGAIGTSFAIPVKKEKDENCEYKIYR